MKFWQSKVENTERIENWILVGPRIGERALLGGLHESARHNRALYTGIPGFG